MLFLWNCPFMTKHELFNPLFVPIAESLAYFTFLANSLDLHDSYRAKLGEKREPHEFRNWNKIANDNNCDLNSCRCKGIVSPDEYFFEDPKIRWFSQFSVAFLWRKSKMKFLLASMKSLTNCEILSSNPLQRACSGFLIAACVLKSCSETRLWFWKLFWKPAINVH